MCFSGAENKELHHSYLELNLQDRRRRSDQNCFLSSIVSVEASEPSPCLSAPDSVTAQCTELQSNVDLSEKKVKTYKKVSPFYQKYAKVSTMVTVTNMQHIVADKHTEKADRRADRSRPCGCILFLEWFHWFHLLFGLLSGLISGWDHLVPRMSCASYQSKWAASSFSNNPRHYIRNKTSSAANDALLPLTKMSFLRAFVCLPNNSKLWTDFENVQYMLIMGSDQTLVFIQNNLHPGLFIIARWHSQNSSVCGPEQEILCYLQIFGHMQKKLIPNCHFSCFLGPGLFSFFVLPLKSFLLVFNQRLLVSCIEDRLRSLEEMRGALQTEVQENVAHGEALEVLVRERCLPVELERYNLFIGDLERVVSLLLCLSARLARVQNALSTVDQYTDAEEKVRKLWSFWTKCTGINHCQL